MLSSVYHIISSVVMFCCSYIFFLTPSFRPITINQPTLFVPLNPCLHQSIHSSTYSLITPYLYLLTHPYLLSTAISSLTHPSLLYTFLFLSTHPSLLNTSLFSSSIHPSISPPYILLFHPPTHLSSIYPSCYPPISRPYILLVTHPSLVHISFLLPTHLSSIYPSCYPPISPPYILLVTHPSLLHISFLLPTHFSSIYPSCYPPISPPYTPPFPPPISHFPAKPHTATPLLTGDVLLRGPSVAVPVPEDEAGRVCARLDVRHGLLALLARLAVVRVREQVGALERTRDGQARHWKYKQKHSMRTFICCCCCCFYILS